MGKVRNAGPQKLNFPNIPTFQYSILLYDYVRCDICGLLLITLYIFEEDEND